MLKISKLTDYGLLAAVYLARHNGDVASAREIAEFYHLPVPMITKVLKTLHQADVIDSQPATNRLPVGAHDQSEQSPSCVGPTPPRVASWMAI